MPLSDSANFLPPYLQTIANRRFLGSTLDLLINQPALTRFNGFIGRETYEGTVLSGNYLLETTPIRQNYQLESAFVTYDLNQNITAVSNFLDVLNASANKDSVTSSWNRLLTANMYSWQGFNDLDKIINYQNYCWISTINNNWYWNNSILIQPIGTVQTDILGQISYTDPTGISLLNGMIISFPTTQPAPYNNLDAYIVEGVGLEINLVPVTNIVIPEFAIDQNVPPDYITIARDAIDLNLWSRTNLWVHKDTVNSIIQILTSQGNTATIPTKFTLGDRPIIEFNPLVLFNSGKIGVPAVTYFDDATIDAFYIVQGQNSFVVDGFQLNDGDSVIFNADHNSSIRPNIYDVNFVDPTMLNQVPRLYPVQAVSTSNIVLSGLQTIDGYVTQLGDRILVKSQTNASQNGIYTASNIGWIRTNDFTGLIEVGVLVLYGTVYKQNYFLYNQTTQIWSVSATQPVIQLVLRNTAITDNSALITSGVAYGDKTVFLGSSYWLLASQNKISINQAPLFDIFDLNNISFGNVSVYPDSSFTGSELFSYEIGIGSNDTVLGFPLTYGPVGNLNDVIFDNNYVTDTFSYNGVSSAQLILAGRSHLIDPLTGVEAIFDAWQYIDSNLELYQNYLVTGLSTITFSGNLLVKSTPNSGVTQVYVDGSQLSQSDFTVSQNNGKITISINTDIDIANDSSIVIKILSTTQIPGAWYDVPYSFDHNPLGQILDTFNMGQLRLHATTSQENANDTTGIVDLFLNEYQGVAGSILFQESISMLPSLLLCNSVYDIDNALRTAGEDYTLFKQRFLNTATQIPNISNLTTKQAVDQTLQRIASTSISGQPWATSDMCYWGGSGQTLVVTNTHATIFTLKQTYNFTQANNQELQVYRNNSQLVLGIDYNVNGNQLTILSSLSIGDSIAIYEIPSTIGGYIPATPTKLGLAQSYVPQIYTDYTYQTPRQVIQGHDGSITTCYGDYRDAMLLDYELRVFNNLKVNNQLLSDTIQTYVPDGGRWRSEEASTNAAIAPYSPSELLAIQQRMFYEWAAEYNVTYENSFYDADDLFTWNWRSSLDKLSDHEPLLGYWRGIYRWFYDTENINTKPWEALGITIKPTWWDTVYGAAPYTGGNSVLWHDIANGIINDPTGVRYSTFGTRMFGSNSVTEVIPVDNAGNLLDPNDSVVGVFNDSSATDDFVFGDGGPTEEAWRRSSIYSFAKLRAQILQNPLFMCGTLWDTNNYLPTVGFNQFRFKGNYLGSVNQIVLNSVDNNGTATVNSLLNYSIEYLRRQGQNPSQIREAISNTTVQLMYPLGGYSSANDITAYGDPNNPSDVGSAELIPVQDYSLFLNKSTPIGTLNYSGLIINLTSSNTYQISGYNRFNPFFTIYEANTYGPSVQVGVAPNFYVYPKSFGTIPQVVPYNTIFPNIQSVINFIAGYENFLVSNGLTFTTNFAQTQVEWQSAAIQFIKWSLTTWNTTIPLSLVLNPSASIINYTALSGTLYDLTDPLDSLVLDVNGAVVTSQFLDVFRDDNSVTITHQGGGVFSCIEADIVSYEHRVVFDNETAFNDTIYDPIGAVRQIRLTFSGQKSANWNGTLSSPGFLITTNNVQPWTPNQDYLFGSLVQWKNNNYVANQDVIGSTTFQYSQFQLISTIFTNNILPNLSLKAQDYQNAYNINYRPFLTDLVNLRNNTIGYIERDWLSILDIDLGGQTDFYRGWIKEKGSLNSLTSYARGSRPQLNTVVDINEEYAMKVGVYGSDSRTGYGEVSLPPIVNTQNPLVISFVPTPNSADANSIQVTPNSLYEKSPNWTNDFIQNYGNLQLTTKNFTSGGPVIPQTIIQQAENTIQGFLASDAQYLFFPNLADMPLADQASILKIAENGGSFWIENNQLVPGPNQWDVLTFNAASTGISSISQLNSNTICFILSTDIGVSANSIVVVNYNDAAANVSISGSFLVSNYFIAPFRTANSVGYSNLTITTSTNQFGNVYVNYPNPVPTSDIYVSRSLRANSIAESTSIVFDSTQYVVNDATGETAYELNAPYSTEITYGDVNNGVPITSLAYDSVNQVVWVGKPSAVPSGIVELRVVGLQEQTNGTTLPTFDSPIYTIQPRNPNSSNLGRVVAAANNFSAATADADGLPGQIYISTNNQMSAPTVIQILSANTSVPYQVTDLAMSNDANWLYAVEQSNGNIANVAVFALQTNANINQPWFPVYPIISTVANASITVGEIIPDEFSITVSITDNLNYSTRILIPNFEYTVSGNV
jgi:hypothetical protein